MTTDGAVTGQPRVWLRLEGLAVLVASLLFYRWQLESWWTFAALFLLPDLSMLAYAAGPAAGARLHNLAHNQVAPIFLICYALSVGREDVAPYGLVWLAHIGFDRLCGLGLKYPDAFGHTHLGTFTTFARVRTWN